MSTIESTPTLNLIAPESRLLAGIAMPVSGLNPVRLAGWCALQQDQDARTVDRGYDVTKFATRLGPPPCSPPV